VVEIISGNTPIWIMPLKIFPELVKSVYIRDETTGFPSGLEYDKFFFTVFEKRRENNLNNLTNQRRDKS